VKGSKFGSTVGQTTIKIGAADWADTWLPQVYFEMDTPADSGLLFFNQTGPRG